MSFRNLQQLDHVAASDRVLASSLANPPPRLICPPPPFIGPSSSSLTKIIRFLIVSSRRKTKDRLSVSELVIPSRPSWRKED